ncbi:MAG: hypothetical protein N3F63_01875 [Thermoplasmata archaeon]|nr:hypothetical protein [Thermoplasmata archaeon]
MERGIKRFIFVSPNSGGISPRNSIRNLIYWRDINLARTGGQIMLSRIRITGFRSLKNVDIETGPLTVLYGHTAGGKSSFLYAPLVLKNFLINPDQPFEGLSNLGFINLGNFEKCVYGGEKDGKI